MNLKTNLKRIWTIAAALSLGLMIYLYFGEIESATLVNTILALDVVMFILSLPVSVFAAPVVFSAWYFLELNPLAEGVYLNTIVLFLLGALQWFWLIRFYFPPESPFQRLDLAAE
jgi:hypothetical protein